MTHEAHELTLRERIDETPDACSFVFDVPPELADRFTYRAGQFLTFEIPWDDFRIKRCYSLCSTPGVDPHLKVAVKRVEGGRMSNWMCDNLQPGHTIQVEPPEGRFVLDPARGDDVSLTLFAGGSGITPMISILKDAIVNTGRHVKLVYANRDEPSIIFKAELATLAVAHPDRVEVVHHLDADAGFLAAAQIREHLRGREQGEVYVCGPTPFMDIVQEGLDAAGVPTTHAHFERFISPTDPDRKVAAPPVDIPEGSHPDSFTLLVDGKPTEVPVLEGQTLLECAKEAGVRAPHSCEEGFCGCCMAQLVSGDVTMGSTEALTPAEIAAGRVLLCQARCTSAAPVTVDYDLTNFAAPVVSGDDSGGGGGGMLIAGLVLIALVAAGAYFLM